MAESNATDLRVQKTQDAIQTAIKEMICEMDAADITVKELTERAHIHRKTFYLHYTCIDALFEDLLGQITEEYYHAIDQLPIDAPFTEVNRVFFRVYRQTGAVRRAPFMRTGYREFADKLFLNTMIHNRTRHNPYAAFSREEQNIINTFLCVTSVNIYRQWVADKKRVPLERLIALSGTLLSNGVISLF